MKNNKEKDNVEYLPIPLKTEWQTPIIIDLIILKTNNQGNGAVYDTAYGADTGS